MNVFNMRTALMSNPYKVSYVLCLLAPSGGHNSVFSWPSYGILGKYCILSTKIEFIIIWNKCMIDFTELIFDFCKNAGHINKPIINRPLGFFNIYYAQVEKKCLNLDRYFQTSSNTGSNKKTYLSLNSFYHKNKY